MTFTFTEVTSTALTCLAGAVAGIICKAASDRLSEVLLVRRNRKFSQSRSESMLMYLVSAFIGILILNLMPICAETVYMFILLTLCESVAIIDIHERIIPNELCLFIIIVTIVFGLPGLFGAAGFPEFSIKRSLLGLAICFAIFCLPSALSKKVGAGDVKLAAAMGFCLGLGYSLLSIILMGVFVLGYTVLQNKVPTLRMIKNMIPMGPFLAASTVAILLAGKIPALSLYTEAFLF